ncbi:MAG: asparagine synthase (glutamine-hydrolyzing) [Patescibacteria group bacterium]
MCGINGFNWQDENLVKKMNTKIAHRGPDDEGSFVAPNISLGQRRLSIIDLSLRGHQPMHTADKRYSIVFNGEIYNFFEIKERLKGKYNFSSDSDTEVVLYSFAEWGALCLEKFNGIFAFAIWDNLEQKLFLARDRAGVKPLYYYYDGKRFIFSSEVKAILEHDVPREINRQAQELFFRVLYVPGPLTMFKDIMKIPPAHYLVFKDGRIETKKYWQVQDFINFKSYGEAKESVRNIFDDSVRGQLISDRPVGVFLSGGIDSTAVLGAAKKYMRGAINTYSVGFTVAAEGEKFNADFNLAKKTAEFYGTSHHEVVVSGKDVLDNLEKVIYYMDEPVANSIQIATMLLAKRAKQDVAVVLGGDGGDEIFGGYPRYYFSYLISLYQKIFKGKIRDFTSGVLEKIIKANDLGEKLNAPAGINRWSAFMLQKENQVGRILRNGGGEREGAKKYFDENFFLPYKNKFGDFEKIFMLVDTANWLVDESLIRSDKMAMAYGLEERVPILDHRLIEIAAKIPTKWKVGDSKQGKRIWKDAVLDYLPEFVRNHPKHGFFSPGAKWLRAELKDFAQNVFSGLDNSMYNKEEALKMLKDHLEMKRYNLNLIWAILTFEVWKKTYGIR